MDKKANNLVLYFDEFGNKISKRKFISINKKSAIGDKPLLLSKALKSGIITKDNMNELVQKNKIIIKEYKGKKYVNILGSQIKKL